MNIRDLLTLEQYEKQLQEYNKLVKNNEITFFQFLTETYKIKSKWLDDLITETVNNIKYHEQRLQEEQTKLDAYYTARDAKADNPYSKWKQHTHKNRFATTKNGASGSAVK